MGGSVANAGVKTPRPVSTKIVGSDTRGGPGGGLFGSGEHVAGPAAAPAGIAGPAASVVQAAMAEGAPAAPAAADREVANTGGDANILQTTRPSRLRAASRTLGMV